MIKQIRLGIVLAVVLSCFGSSAIADPRAGTFYQFNGGATGVISSGTTVTLPRLGSLSNYMLTLGTGGGAYTVQLVLPDTGFNSGDVYFIPVTYPASTNPTLKVYDSGTNGTLLHSSTGTAIAGSTVLRFVNVTGTAWAYNAEGAVLQRNLGAGVYPALQAAPGTSNGFLTGSSVGVYTAVPGLFVTSPGAGMFTVGGTPSISGSAQQSGTANWLASSAFGNAVIYSNQLSGIHLNSNVYTGGGTDDRAVLQTALNNINAAGGGTLVLTGAALVSGSLALWSNERIVGLQEGTCGLYLSGSSNVAVLTNVHRSYLQNSDSNICVENLTVNGNGAPGSGTINQAQSDSNGNWVHGIDFNGVTNPQISKVQIIDARNYAINLTSCDYPKVEHIWCFWHNPSIHNDGVHLDAPYNDVLINDFWGNGFDDQIALDGDENAYGAAQNYDALPLIDVSGTAASSRVRVYNISVANASDAVRICSNVARADDILIDGVHGTVEQYAILIDQGGNAGGYSGNLGNVTIRDVDIQASSDQAWSGQKFIAVLNHVDSLTLNNMAAQNYAQTYFGPWLYLGPNAEIRTLSINGSWHDENFTLMSGTVGRIQVDGAWVHNLNLGPIAWEKPEGTGSGGILMTMDAGEIDNLNLDGISTNNGIAILKQSGGRIGTIDVSNLQDRAASGASIVLSDTNTNVAIGSAITGALLSGSAPAAVSGTGNVITTGTGIFPTGRYAYQSIYKLNGPASSANDSGPNFGAPLVPMSGSGGISAGTDSPFGYDYIFTGGTNGCLVGAPITLPNNCTLLAWVKFASNSSSYGGLFASMNVAANGSTSLWTFLSPSGSGYEAGIHLISSFGNYGDYVNTTVMAVNTWHLIVYEISGSGCWISVDGGSLQAFSFTGPLNNDTTDPLAFGALNVGAGATTTEHPFVGRATNLVIFNSLLSSGDISTIWNGGAGLAAPYP